MAKVPSNSLSEKVHEKGCPLINCVGFLDGTFLKICRPSKLQRGVYSGYKRAHGLKFQAVCNPAGGPFTGREHDASMLRDSGLLYSLHESYNFENRKFCIYADPAYGLGPYLQVGFKGTLSPIQAQYNLFTSQSRIAVEWGFGKVSNIFTFLKFDRSLKLWLQPIAKYYRVATILTNVHTCLYGCQTAKYFDIEVCSVEDYLNCRN